MQGIGHIIYELTGEKILVLVRQGSYGRHIKRRKTGKDGVQFTDEQIFLNDPEQKERLEALKEFKPIFC